MDVSQDLVALNTAQGPVFVGMGRAVPTNLHKFALRSRGEIYARLALVAREPAPMGKLRRLVGRVTSKSFLREQDLLGYVADAAAATTHELLVLDLSEQRFSYAPVSVDGMQLSDRFTEVLKRVPKYLGPEVGEQFKAMLTPAALATMAATLAIWAGAHFCGVGEAIDIVLVAVGFAMLGWQVFDIAKLLVKVIKRTLDAKSDPDLDAAAKDLAEVIAKIGVAVFIALVTKALGKHIQKHKAAQAKPVEPAKTAAPPKPAQTTTPAPAKATDVPETMASRVESKLARPIPADRMRSLESRWDQIGKDAAALEGKPIDPKKLAELDDLRMGNSRTVTGREGLEEAARAEANWKKANEQVGEWVRNGDDVSVERINKLNEIVGDGLTHNGGIPGQLRPEGMDSAAGHISRLYLPGGAEVESSMGNYMSWYGANKNMPPVQLAGESYQRLVSIHPYADGNGRTTRLVADWILQKNGLPPAAMGSAEKNVAVFGFHELAPDVCPRANAVEAVTSGVEKSLSILGGK